MRYLVNSNDSKTADLWGYDQSSGGNMSGLEIPPTGLQSSRRNLIRIGAIVASAIIAKTMSAAARDRDDDDSDWDRDRKIEDLAVGDLLPTIFGGISPIQWIGRYRFKRSDPTKRWVKDVLPIRVARSALGPDIPQPDLYVTQQHALLI